MKDNRIHKFFEDMDIMGKLNDAKAKHTEELKKYEEGLLKDECSSRRSDTPCDKRTTNSPPRAGGWGMNLCFQCGQSILSQEKQFDLEKEHALRKATEAKLEKIAEVVRHLENTGDLSDVSELLEILEGKK